MKLVYEKFGHHNLKVLRFLAKYNIYFDYIKKCKVFYLQLNPSQKMTDELEDGLREYYFYFKTLI